MRAGETEYFTLPGNLLLSKGFNYINLLGEVINTLLKSCANTLLISDAGKHFVDMFLALNYIPLIHPCLLCERGIPVFHVQKSNLLFLMCMWQWERKHQPNFAPI